MKPIKSTRAYLLVLLVSMGYWFRPEDPQGIVQNLAETANLEDILSNLSLTDVLSPEFVLGPSYYSLWTKLNKAMSAAILHFQDAPNVPVYRLLPLLKLQFEYIAEHRMDKHVVKREYDMFGARHTSLERLEAFEEMEGFAEAAYTNDLAIRAFLSSTGYDLLQFEPAVTYEKPSYFVAFNPHRKHAIISVKGTSSVSDLLTDVLHTPVEFLHDSWVHSGMLNAAVYIVNRTDAMISHLFGPLGYRVTFTGHSLGAGTAQLATLIYRWERAMTNIDCVVIAPPPTLNRQALNWTKDIIWSVVAGDDIIPRWNFGLISANARILADVDKEMQETGMSLEEFYEEFDYLTMIQEYRKTIEEVATSKGAHIDMHIAGDITYITRTHEGFMVRDVEADFSSLRRIEFSTTMLSDHTLDFYRHAVSTVAEQLRDPNIHDDGGLIFDMLDLADELHDDSFDSDKSSGCANLNTMASRANSVGEQSEEDDLQDADVGEQAEQLRQGHKGFQKDQNVVEGILEEAEETNAQRVNAEEPNLNPDDHAGNIFVDPISA